MMQHSKPSLSLETILTSTQHNMQQLLHILKNETLILEKNSTEEFESITLEKITLTEQIKRNEQQRIHYLTTKSLDPNKPVQWLQNNRLISAWSEIKKLSEQAQKQNQINGLIINDNRRRIQTQIEILNTSSPAIKLVYSASGKDIKQRNSNTLAHV